LLFIITELFHDKGFSMRLYAFKFLIIIMLSSISGFCVIITKDNIITNKNIQLTISGSAALEEGQFVNSHHDTLIGNNGNQPMWAPSPGPIWLHRAYARLTFEAWVQDRLRIIVSPEVKLYVDSYPLVDVPSPKNYYLFTQRSYVDIADGEGIYSFGDLNKPYLQFVAGVFPYKYNPDAANLGEYLFRSGCYPPYLLTSFDEPYARLSGLQIKFNPIENLKFDALLTTETKAQPLYDWSLSFIADYKISSFINVGAGIDFNRLFSVYGDVTTPTTQSTGSSVGNEYLTANGDSSYYSFKGTKLMGMLSIDPKGLLPSNLANIFGKEDCKFFGEAAVLGATNYPAYKYRDPDNGD
jgi:hypothetical protein